MESILTLILVISILVECCSAISFGTTYSKYTGIIDAGSTGSRFYLFRMDRNNAHEILKMVEVYSSECQPGINSYVDRLNEVWTPIHGLLKGSDRVVSTLESSIPLYIFATAGMRVLSVGDQHQIYDALYAGYRRSYIRYSLSRENLRTIDGEMEAVYGWLTVNVLKSRISPSLKYTNEPTIGSLDLGGESTQIAYQYKPRENGKLVDISADLFSKSFLSYGAKEMQFRYENYILSKRATSRSSELSLTNPLYTPNPCNNQGLVVGSSVYRWLHHEGTGNMNECKSILTYLLHGDTSCNDNSNTKCSLWSLCIPIVEGDFVGMSLFFFVVDFLKSIYHLGDSVQPSIEQLKTYGKSFCSTPWKEVLEQFSGKHKYTDNTTLKQRCFQINYVIALLEHGYGLVEVMAKSSFSIDFLRYINGESVDWTYGAALLLGREPVAKQISRFVLVVVLSLLFLFLVLLVLSNRTVRIRYKKLPLI